MGPPAQGRWSFRWRIAVLVAPLQSSADAQHPRSVPAPHTYQQDLDAALTELWWPRSRPSSPLAVPPLPPSPAASDWSVGSVPSTPEGTMAPGRGTARSRQGEPRGSWEVSGPGAGERGGSGSAGVRDGQTQQRGAGSAQAAPATPAPAQAQGVRQRSLLPSLGGETEARGGGWEGIKGGAQGGTPQNTTLGAQ